MVNLRYYRGIQADKLEICCVLSKLKILLREQSANYNQNSVIIESLKQDIKKTEELKHKIRLKVCELYN